ncbi:hypothetical protein TNCV_5108101 [Trichonephila clavipes]|nr:hypothetical protein TNCV_5108101 [Trichonephila clavipes]
MMMMSIIPIKLHSSVISAGLTIGRLGRAVRGLDKQDLTSGINPDLILAHADISDVAEREVIYDPGFGHHMIVTTFNFNTKKSAENSVITPGKIITSKAVSEIASFIELLKILSDLV